MAASVSSTSSNECHQITGLGENYDEQPSTTAGEKGFHLSSNQSPSSPRTGSRSPTPPPTILVHSSAASSNSPILSSRNGLGLTCVSGLGMTHSGSYLATSVRTSSKFPLLIEEPDIYDEIYNMLKKRKMLELSQLEALKSKQNVFTKITQEFDVNFEKNTASEIRAAAYEQLAQKREQLEKLMLQRTELEKSVRSEWKERIDEFKQQSLIREEEEINEIKRKHEQELKKMIEEARLKSKAEEEDLESKLNKRDYENWRKSGTKTNATSAKADTHGDMMSTPKKQKIIDHIAENKNEMHGTKVHDNSMEPDEGDDLYLDLCRENPAKAPTVDSKVENSDDDNELFGDDSGDELEKTQMQKNKVELKKITHELNDLNEIKSQMVWLLKEVITAEAKLKMKQKLGG